MTTQVRVPCVATVDVINGYVRTVTLAPSLEDVVVLTGDRTMDLSADGTFWPSLKRALLYGVDVELDEVQSQT